MYINFNNNPDKVKIEVGGEIESNWNQQINLVLLHYEEDAGTYTDRKYIHMLMCQGSCLSGCLGA